MLGTSVYFLIGMVCLAGSDQITIQRYLTTRDAATARRAYRTSCMVMAGTFTLMGVVGAAVLGFFQLHPEALPAGMTVAKNGDACYPYYMGHYLPAGISGFGRGRASLAAGISGLVVPASIRSSPSFSRISSTSRRSAAAARRAPKSAPPASSPSPSGSPPSPAAWAWPWSAAI